MNSPAPAPRSEETLFAAAQALPPAERAAYLENACAGDAHLLARVNALLSSDEAAESFMAAPAEAGLATALSLQAPPIHDAAVGDCIGRYKLLQKIGEGGCGTVFVAEQQEPVRRRVALKIIKLGMDTREVIARFEAERQALALMEHPNIARVFDAGATATGRPYFVMELVRGVEITRYCDEQNLATEARLELFTQVCHAVEHAHQKGIIHRDLKPSNILVTLHDGVPVPKIIDFGIAKATQGRLVDATVFTALEQFIGTPAYMSPEQAEMSGLEIDTRSDIYSLGVLLYELLTGRPPFDPKTLVSSGLDEIRRVIREIEPPRPSLKLDTLAILDRATIARQRGIGPTQLATRLRGDLDWIVMRCLEKQRVRRYDSASDLAQDVRRHLQDEPIRARPPGMIYRLQKFVRRQRVLVAASVAVLLAAGGGLASAKYFTSPAVSPTSECHLFRVPIHPETGRPEGPPVQLTRKSIVRRDPPAVSPDGRRIAFWSREGDANGLALMDADGRNRRPVASPSGHGRLTWLSADELLFQAASGKSGDPVTLSVLHLKTGAVRPFVRADIGPSGFDWQFVPARNEVVYLSRDTDANGRLFKAHALSDGSVRSIARVANLTNFRHCFSVSPDGAKIAYGVYVTTGGTRTMEMRLMNIDGTPEKTVLPAAGAINEGWRPSGLPYAWSPNGKFLLFDQFPGGIAVLNVATSETWLVRGALDEPPYEWALVNWSPTGDFLVLNRYRTH